MDWDCPLQFAQPFVAKKNRRIRNCNQILVSVGVVLFIELVLYLFNLFILNPPVSEFGLIDLMTIEAYSRDLRRFQPFCFFTQPNLEASFSQSTRLYSDNYWCHDLHLQTHAVAMVTTVPSSHAFFQCNQCSEPLNLGDRLTEEH